MELIDFLIKNNPCPVSLVKENYEGHQEKLLKIADEGKILIAPAEGVLYTWVEPSILSDGIGKEC